MGRARRGIGMRDPEDLSCTDYLPSSVPRIGHCGRSLGKMGVGQGIRNLTLTLFTKGFRLFRVSC